MKNILALLSLAVTVLISAQAALAYSLEVNLINQDPIPAQRGEAVDLLFKADVTDTSSPPKNLIVSMVEEYPFTAVSDISIEFGDVSLLDFEEPFTFKFRVFIDESADDGDSEIEIGYSASDFSNLITKKYNVSVTETRTDFDVVVQDISDSGISLGMVNSGKNSASSVVVRIPEQENFDVDGVSSNVIGDLTKGDFTIITFNIVPKATEKGDLSVDVSYTDSIGNRFTVQKQVPLEITEQVQGQQTNGQSQRGDVLEDSQSEIILGVLVIAGIAGFVIYRKRKKRKSK